LNHQTPYELTIAQKLQQLPLPDMADAIWARVERQLDIDMPTDNDGGDPTSSPSGSGWTGGAAFGLFVGAFALVFLLFKKERKAAPLTVPEQTTVTPLPTEQRIKTANRPEKNTTIFLPPASTISPQAELPAPQTPRPDSVVTTMFSPKPDSQQTTSVVLPPQEPMKDSVKPKRGVTGITDNDYRIVPTKKDSS
jgi:hypothetical protein